MEKILTKANCQVPVFFSIFLPLDRKYQIDIKKTRISISYIAFAFEVICRTFHISPKVLDAAGSEKWKVISALLFPVRRSQRRHAVYRRSQRLN